MMIGFPSSRSFNPLDALIMLIIVSGVLWTKLPIAVLYWTFILSNNLSEFKYQYQVLYNQT